MEDVVAVKIAKAQKQMHVMATTVENSTNNHPWSTHSQNIELNLNACIFPRNTLNSTQATESTQVQKLCLKLNDKPCQDL